MKREPITESKLISLGFLKHTYCYRLLMDSGDVIELSYEFQFVSDDGYIYPNKLFYMDELQDLVRLLTGQILSY